MRHGMNRASSRILFLFNHDAAHQAAHVAGIMECLALRGNVASVVAASGKPTIARTVRQLISTEAAARIEWVDLSLSRVLDLALALPNQLLPARRIVRLDANTALFANSDLVVSPERTCLRIRRRLRRRAADRTPEFVFVPHGAGDRSVTYHTELAQFDHHLVSGAKTRDQMIANGIASPDNCQVIGYAKFDAHSAAARPAPFSEGRPTILYNPHFDPHLSSWYDHGPRLLEMLAELRSHFNVIFAPHVMLFRKRLHISPEYRVARWRPAIPEAARQSANMLIDVDSPRLFDMTYTRAADIYVGDVSSQVYEFLKEPGACFFLDAAKQGPNALQFWQNGPVFEDAGRLIEALGHWREIAAQHEETQRRLFAYTIDIDPDCPAPVRGAIALEEIVRKRLGE